MTAAQRGSSNSPVKSQCASLGEIARQPAPKGLSRQRGQRRMTGCWFRCREGWTGLRCWPARPGSPPGSHSLLCRRWHTGCGAALWIPDMRRPRYSGPWDTAMRSSAGCCSRPAFAAGPPQAGSWPSRAPMPPTSLAAWPTSTASPSNSAVEVWVVLLPDSRWGSSVRSPPTVPTDESGLRQNRLDCHSRRTGIERTGAAVRAEQWGKSPVRIHPIAVAAGQPPGARLSLDRRGPGGWPLPTGGKYAPNRCWTARLRGLNTPGGTAGCRCRPRRRLGTCRRRSLRDRRP